MQAKVSALTGRLDRPSLFCAAKCTVIINLKEIIGVIVSKLLTKLLSVSCFLIPHVSPPALSFNHKPINQCWMESGDQTTG